MNNSNNSKVWIKIIGDCHGVINRRSPGRSYFNLIDKAEYSIQIGDLGYPHRSLPDFHDKINEVDKTHHVVVLGNHDDYNQRVQNALGDFGIHSFPNFEFFYMRGAYSPDRVRRLVGIDWWEEEQLTTEQGWAAVKFYQEKKPDIVITHDCPEAILYYFYGGACFVDRTNRILQTMLEIHRPRIFIFGHHHRNWMHEYKGTTFICLDGQVEGHQMGFIDFDNQGNLIGGPQ